MPSNASVHRNPGALWRLLIRFSAQLKIRCVCILSIALIFKAMSLRLEATEDNIFPYLKTYTTTSICLPILLFSVCSALRWVLLLPLGLPRLSLRSRLPLLSLKFILRAERLRSLLRRRSLYGFLLSFVLFARRATLPRAGTRVFRLGGEYRSINITA